MSELKVYKELEDYLGYEKDSPIEMYDKYEADKVIAELEKKLDIYKRGWMENDRVNANQYAEIRHHKYKRCLAMALLALEKRETYRAEYEEWCLKWYKRWFKIAEQFKEAK